MPVRRGPAAKTLIGLDIGSTSVKAALVAPGSGVLHVARRTTETHVVRGGGAFHKPAELLATVGAVVAECVAAAGSNKPVGIGIASMAEAGVVIDRRGAPVGEILAWFDPRPERQAAWLERQIGAGPLFARTGLRPEPKYTLPKLLWLREHKAADFTRLRHWAGVAEMVALDLTGELATNASLACRTLAFDIRSSAWDAELLGLASLAPDAMPVVLPLGEPVGRLTAAAASRLGLAIGTPVAVAGHDHLAAAIGAGVTRPGEAMDSMGSAEAALLVTRSPAPTDELRRGGFSAGCHAIDGLGYVVGGLQSSGALVEWFLDTFLPTGAAEDRYAIFTELLEAAGPGPVEPLVRPYLRGRTAPHRDPSATLEIEGLRETHSLADVAAAVVDGCAYHVRWMLDELARVTATQLGSVKLTGGGVRNKRWVRAKSALGPGRLEVVRTDETAALGAALVAGMAGGVYGSLAEALVDVSPFDRVTAPAGARSRYDAAYLDRWLPAVLTKLRQSGPS
jgi:xylulokinase